MLLDFGSEIGSLTERTLDNFERTTSLMFLDRFIINLFIAPTAFESALEDQII